jgi:hypothetical protein
VLRTTSSSSPRLSAEAVTSLPPTSIWSPNLMSTLILSSTKETGKLAHNLLTAPSKEPLSRTRNVLELAQLPLSQSQVETRTAVSVSLALDGTAAPLLPAFLLALLLLLPFQLLLLRQSPLQSSHWLQAPQLAQASHLRLYRFHHQLLQFLSHLFQALL